MEVVKFAACDLDKTLYPPPGPEHHSQLVANVDAMHQFEGCGGVVFPVTGNNLQMAQKKFMDPSQSKRMLREVRKNPGIFTNGALVLGAAGKIIEKHSLGNLICKDRKGGDFITRLLDFFDEHRNKSIIEDVGLMVLCPELMAGYKKAYFHVEGFAQHMKVPALVWSKDELIQSRKDILQVIILYPELKSADSKLQCEEYMQTVRPRQEELQRAFKAYGLLDSAYEEELISGVGAGVNMTFMKDPWPSIDINVAGVNKGNALARFLNDATVLKYLKRSTRPTAETIAVFGDAANDVPMFKEVDGSKPLWRVAMPHATDPDLLGSCNVRAQVGETLLKFVYATEGQERNKMRVAFFDGRKVNESEYNLLKVCPLNNRFAVCILGSTSFQEPSSEELVKQISTLITAKSSFRQPVVFITGGMAGVQKVFAENSCDGSTVCNLVPEGSRSCFLKGLDVSAGSDQQEKRKILGLVGTVYITIEGGPGVAEEAKAAADHSALVLPIQRSGGASSGMFSFPQSALSKPWCATEDEWRLLADRNTPIEKTASACLSIIQKFMSQRSIGTQTLEFDLHQFSCRHQTPCRIELFFRHLDTCPNTEVQVLLLCKHMPPQQFEVGCTLEKARIKNKFEFETCLKHDAYLSISVKGTLPGTLSLEMTFKACDGTISIFNGSLHKFGWKSKES